MTRTTWMAALLAAGALGGTAYAGMKTTAWGHVVINGSTAEGSIGRARNTPNTVEFIGCHLYGSEYTPGSSHKSGFCWATDANYKYLMCSTNNDSAIVDVMQAVNSTSFIRFSVDRNGYCTAIEVHNRSMHEPPQP